jgi:hypothetical protein
MTRVVEVTIVGIAKVAAGVQSREIEFSMEALPAYRSGNAEIRSRVQGGCAGCGILLRETIFGMIQESRYAVELESLKVGPQRI